MEEISSEKIIEKKEEEGIDLRHEEKKMELVDILKMFSPGTSIRLAIDDIQRAGLGALIVLEKEGLEEMIEGGFKINCRFSSQRLVELAKMDGAIVVSKDLKKIIVANTLLVPKIEITTRETGTRHKAAERTAKQLNTITIAVSERKNKVTIYYDEFSYVLEPTSDVLRKASETLQILEKQKEVLNELLSNLNVLEITNLAMMSDVSGVLQRLEMTKRVSAMVKRHLIELGKEGIVVSMRLKELTKNLGQEQDMILKDYFGSKYMRAKTTLENMNFDFLLETSNIVRMLFGELSDSHVSPKGLRMLSKTNLSEEDTRALISTFKDLDNILKASDDSLMEFFEKEESIEYFKNELKNLREKIVVWKNI